MHPYRDPGRSTQPCPRCALGLGGRALLDAWIDECSACGGVFVPRELLPRILDPLDLGLEVVTAFDAGRVTAEDPRPLRCPRCAVLMARRPLVRGSDVVVDHCARHGVWFDAHELLRLAELAASMDLQLRGAPAGGGAGAARPVQDPLAMRTPIELVRAEPRRDAPAPPDGRARVGQRWPMSSAIPSSFDALLEVLGRHRR